MSDRLTATRDEIGRVLCCHGRPIDCNECGEEYASDLDGPAGGARGDADACERDVGTPQSTGTPQPCAGCAALREALAAIVVNVDDDCPMCDRGRLRNPQKTHWPECPFGRAQSLLAALAQSQPDGEKP